MRWTHNVSFASSLMRADARHCHSSLHCIQSELAALHRTTVGTSLPRTIKMQSSCETHRLLVRIGWQVQHEVDIIGIEQRPCSDNRVLHPTRVVKEEAAMLIKAMPQEQQEVLVVDLARVERSHQVSLRTTATMRLVKRKWQNRDLHPSNPERCTVSPAINWKIILHCRCNGHVITDWT